MTHDFSGLLALSGRCSYLLVALLVMIIAYPFYGGETLGRRLLFGVLTSAILVSGAFAASQRRRTVVIALALAAPALALQWLHTLSGSPILTCFVSCLPPSMPSRLRMSWATCLVRTGHRRQAPRGRRRLHPDGAAMDRSLRFGRSSRPWLLQRQGDKRSRRAFALEGVAVFQLHHADVHGLWRHHSHRWPCSVPGDPGAARRRLLRRDPDRPGRRTLSARHLAANDVAHKWNRWCCPARAERTRQAQASSRGGATGAECQERLGARR